MGHLLDRIVKIGTGWGADCTVVKDGSKHCLKRSQCPAFGICGWAADGRVRTEHRMKEALFRRKKSQMRADGVK